MWECSLVDSSICKYHLFVLCSNPDLSVRKSEWWLLLRIPHAFILGFLRAAIRGIVWLLTQINPEARP
jgi:hypothetical protein